MDKRLLPTSGVNKFQEIKGWMREAEAKGIQLVKLSIGQPAGPALLPVREASSAACLSDQEAMWEYQDNSSLGVPGFALRFTQCHVKTNLSPLLAEGAIGVLPVPGLKPMLGPVIQAMGSWTEERRSSLFVTRVRTMTKPGYPTPADQCAMIKGVEHDHLPATASDDLFLFDPGEGLRGLEVGDLVMLNLPHNPTGVVGNRPWLERLCGLCQERGVRLWNDGAYAILAHDQEAVTLTDVAVKFPDLGWAEGFSSSKAGNNTGARVGTIVGSPGFVADIAQIKGNTDSGFVAPMAAGVLNLYENHRVLIEEVRAIYERRLHLLISILRNWGMRLSVYPAAGFFCLFDCPRQAFGQEIISAKHFNQLMIEKTGVVGVQFDPYMRYAVCTADVEELAPRIGEAFRAAAVSY